MVGMYGLIQDIRPFQQRAYRLADHTIINSPAFILGKLVPDGAPYFIHTEEGPDDMSAHIKASLIGTSVTIPIRNHRLNLGTWQGIYLCEFRDGGDRRKLSITILE